MRGPDLAIHRPPKKAATPSVKMVMLNVAFTAETDAPYCCVSASRKTLQAYTAPSATCITTPATAMIARLPAPELLAAWAVIQLLLSQSKTTPPVHSVERRGSFPTSVGYRSARPGVIPTQARREPSP